MRPEFCQQKWLGPQDSSSAFNLELSGKLINRFENFAEKTFHFSNLQVFGITVWVPHHALKKQMKDILTLMTKDNKFYNNLIFIIWSIGVRVKLIV